MPWALLAAATEEADKFGASWLKFAGFFAALAALGKLIDWGLRKQRKEAILAWMRDHESKIKSLPVVEWQFAVAAFVIGLWTGLARTLNSLFKMSETALTAPTWERMAALLLIVAVVLLAVSGSSLWMPFLLFVGGVFLANAISDSSDTPGRIEKATLSVSLASSAFSFVALASGSLLAHYTLTPDDYWGQRRAVLVLLNFPFDVATVAVSVALLRWVTRCRRWFVTAALLDLAASGILTAFLAVSASAYLGLESSGWEWIRDAVTLRLSAADPALELTPLLFTTFLPVALYVFAFLFLGIVVRFSLIVGAYLCGLLGEKQKTPFFELAVAIGLIGALIKGIVGWLK